MKRTYTPKTTPTGWDYIEYIEDGIVYQVPKDPANSDYQAYLASFDEADSV